jgi:hypothetical protein
MEIAFSLLILRLALFPSHRSASKCSKGETAAMPGNARPLHRHLSIGRRKSVGGKIMTQTDLIGSEEALRCFP